VKLVDVGSVYSWQEAGFNEGAQSFRVNGRRDSYDITLPLLGEHQAVNAVTAVAALEVLAEQGVRISRESVINGLASLSWPGRFQVIGHRPLVIVDGAHNIDSMEKLGRTIQRCRPGEKVVLVVGASSDKDVGGIAATLSPVAGRVIATRSGHARSLAPEPLADAFAVRGIPVEVVPDVAAAVARAVVLAGTDGTVCVTGSFFVVAEALEAAERLPGNG
jgi:dihydrofolate synthase/folylpolyglutamate synthase